MFRNACSVYRDLPTSENGYRGTRGNNSFRADRPCLVTLVEARSPRDRHLYIYTTDFKRFNLTSHDKTNRKRNINDPKHG